MSQEIVIKKFAQEVDKYLNHKISINEIHDLYWKIRSDILDDYENLEKSNSKEFEFYFDVFYLFEDLVTDDTAKSTGRSHFDIDENSFYKGLTKKFNKYFK